MGAWARGGAGCHIIGQLLQRPPVTIDGEVKVDSAISFQADWGIFKLRRASLSGSATASAQLVATAEASASCSLGPITLASWKLPTVSVQVGPVPVVLNPKVTVYLDGKGNVEAKATTSVHGSLTARAGLAWENGATSPIADFDQDFGFDPQSSSSDASAQHDRPAATGSRTTLPS